jgi:integrase
VAQLRKRIKTHPNAGLHALRHTFPTKGGQHTAPFTLQYVAGHDNIKTTIRYVHPREEAVQNCLLALAILIDRRQTLKLGCDLRNVEGRCRIRCGG